jgi:hypothetical protein
MATLTIAESLTNDPARFSEYLCRHYTDPYSCEVAEREVRATCSSIYRGNRRVIAKVNFQGRWSVLVGEKHGDAIHLEWSPVTMDEVNGGLRLIARGEAVMTMSHEMFNVLYTDEVIRPEWCKPEHWREFFTIVNLAEDVRIEDLGEAEVPLFAHLRRVENDRLLGANLTHYKDFDLLRQVGVPWFAKRACSPGSEIAFTSLMDTHVARIVNDLYSDFDAATRAGSTRELLDLLRPVYEACAQYMQSGGGDSGDQPGDPGETGEPTDEGEQGGNADSDDDSGTSVPGPGASNDADEDGDEDGEDAAGSGDDDEDGDDESGDGDDGESDESDTSSGGDGDETTDDADAGDDDGDTQGGGDGGDGDAPDDLSDKPMRPDSGRGQWEQGESDHTPPYDDWERRSLDTVNGNEIDWLGSRGRPGTTYDRFPTTTPVANRVAAQLRRVLQANADGAYVGRRRRGDFDVSSATRIALGDVRIFRKKQGPRGALDFSLVLCLDASSSVTGYVGDMIANAGRAIYEAAERVDGLDVAICVYGSHVVRTIPFGWDRHAGKNPRAYNRLASAIHGGEGGGTGEDDAIVWARAATRKRDAQQGLIVVLTDGGPNNRYAVSDQVQAARREGVLTGGIGVAYPAPEYHQFADSAMDVSSVPSTLANLLRTMMRAR